MFQRANTVCSKLTSKEKLRQTKFAHSESHCNEKQVT